MTIGDPTQRFDRLYEQSEDPWGYHTSTYEQAKYEATFAAIPRHHRGRCLEVGCSIGVFTRLLGQSCQSVMAIDFSSRAIELAAATLAGVENVQLRTASFPEEVPEDRWDLIVCSEVLYYLDERRFTQAMEWLSEQLERDACVLAVSWRGPGKDEPFSGDAVHDRLTERFSCFHTLDARHDRYRLDRFVANSPRSA